MKAVLADIHGNLEALRAVLADLAARNVDGVYCLGDIVGYGPNPLECLDLVMRFPVVLLGNFDHALLVEPDAYPEHLVRHLARVREQLHSSDGDANLCKRREKFLGSLSPAYQEGDVLCVHGSPRHPLHEYVFPEDIYNGQKMGRIFARIDRLCFVGHTHIPGVFTQDRPASWGYLSPEEFGSTYRLDARKALCNVGSVGQPRDGDPRACYVLFDGEAIRFVRVEYDVEATIRKIHDIPDDPDFMGDRLREGR